MNLKNKDIMERMRVTNGKDKLKVISWDKSYTDCLLNYLDSKGNRYVVAQSYELSGTEKDPQISWANGRYFTANSDDEALEEYLDYLGEVNEYDISESLKESKEFFVGSKTWQGYEVCMIEDGKKYYLSKLAKNIEDSSWSSDHTYAKRWKDESRAEEVVDMLNSELKENKKSFKEEIDRTTWGKWVVKNVHHIEYFFNGNIVNEKTLQSLFDSEGFDTDVDTVEDEIKKAVRSYKLENLDGTALHIAHNSVGNRIDLVFNVGGLIGDVESLSKSIDECVIRINGNIYEQDEMWNFGFAIYLTCDVYPLDFSLAESKKKSLRKSLKESAKPINEKNVAKFVDELNKFCDEKIHYVDADAERFTKKYGKMYNFKYRFDDTDEMFVVYDSEGTLDMFDDVGFVREEIDRLAKKNDWYADPYTSSANFTFGEL